MTRAELRLAHARIDEALERLLRAFESDDPEIARRAFRDFDTELSAHLAVEDELLPELARVDAAEAAAIAADHRALRARVDELAIGTDLHSARLPAIRELAATLRAHAKREDDVLYRWIEASAHREAS